VEVAHRVVERGDGQVDRLEVDALVVAVEQLANFSPARTMFGEMVVGRRYGRFPGM